MTHRPISAAERNRVRRLVDERGITAAARILGLSVASVLRITTGAGVIRRGTLMVLRAALAALVAPQKAA